MAPRTTARPSRHGSSRAEPSHASPNQSARPRPLPGLNRCRWRFQSCRVRRSTSSPPPPRQRPTLLCLTAISAPCAELSGRAPANGPSAGDRSGFDGPTQARSGNYFRPIEAGEQADFHDGAKRGVSSLPPAAHLQKAIQVHDSYLIAETRDGMMVIDQHALHERILYEELRTRVAEGRVESQRLLVPEPVDLTAAEAAALVEHGELLAQLGLEVEPFGGDTVLVRSIPAMLPRVVPERLVRDLADHFHSQPLPPTRDGLVAELLHMVACKAAVKAGQPLSALEIEALLERRHLVADSHHCPHGRPTALVFTKADLEKQFGRI